MSEAAHGGTQRVPLVSLIVARADNGVIGRDGQLPWRLPDDLRRFKATTWGKPILMGRRTFESLGRPLPGRENLVLTHDAGFRAAGVTIVHSLDEALRAAAGAPELAVIGGAEVYRLALPLAGRIHLTEVHAAPEGDTRMPPFDVQEWYEVAREEHPADARHAHAVSFVTLERTSDGGRPL